MLPSYKQDNRPMLQQLSSKGLPSLQSARQADDCRNIQRPFRINVECARCALPEDREAKIEWQGKRWQFFSAFEAAKGTLIRLTPFLPPNFVDTNVHAAVTKLAVGDYLCKI